MADRDEPWDQPFTSPFFSWPDPESREPNPDAVAALRGSFLHITLGRNNSCSKILSSQRPDTLLLANSSSFAPNTLEPVKLQSLGLERLKSLGDYFSIDETPRTSYSDPELANIARLLEATGRETWSKVPRIYTVLRQIGQIAAVDSFLDQGLNAMWFPFNVMQLPHTMSAFYRGRFIEVQAMVLTKAMDLENTSVKKHTNFGKGEELPLEIGDKLGKGGFGLVNKARSPLTKREYALKRFQRVKRPRREVESFMTELQVLQRISHHHCVELVASYTDSRYFGLLISPVADCNHTAFYGIVASNEDNKKILRTFFGCLAHALQYLHHNKIRHRDIKPENILVNGTEVYPADFGISLDWENLTRSTTTQDSAMSWMYCAPEVANYEKRNSSSDVWSLGCVFLEMFTALKGLTTHDLRGVSAAHSGQARFYENLSPALQWAERLNERGSGSEKEVVNWICQMMVVEPSSRITAKSLCLTIVKFRFKNKEEPNIFCGECCTNDHELELSSATVSDDDVWEGDFGADTMTPATSAQLTDPSRPEVQSMLEQQEQLEETLSTSSIREDFENVKITEAQGKRLVDDRQDEELPQAPTVSSAPESNKPSQIRSSPRQRGSKSMLQERAETNPTRPASPTRHVLSKAIEGTTDDQDVFQLDSNSGKSEGKHDLDREATIRKELIQEVTNGHTLWPLVDLRDRMPKLTSSSWESPTTFLVSVKSDVRFMKYLKRIDTNLLERVRSANLDDLFPMIHPFLLNGLDADYHHYTLQGGPIKPLLCTLESCWMVSQALHDIAILLIGFGARSGRAYGRSILSGNDQVLQALFRIVPVDGRRLVDGYPTVMSAALRGYHHVVETLIKNGVDHQMTYTGLTAGNLAATQGHHEVLKVLIAHGMDLDEMDNIFQKGRTPLLCAARHGHLETVKYIHSEGADPTRKSSFGYTPLGVAKETGNQEVVKVIEEAVQEWEMKKQKKKS